MLGVAAVSLNFFLDDGLALKINPESPLRKKKKIQKKTVKNGGSHPVGARAARYIADMLHELLATLQ